MWTTHMDKSSETVIRPTNQSPFRNDLLHSNRFDYLADGDSLLERGDLVGSQGRGQVEDMSQGGQTESARRNGLVIVQHPCAYLIISRC
jgi:hypothetical protein